MIRSLEQVPHIHLGCSIIGKARIDQDLLCFLLDVEIVLNYLIGEVSWSAKDSRHPRGVRFHSPHTMSCNSSPASP